MSNHAVAALAILISGDCHSAQELCPDGRILGPARYPTNFFARFPSLDHAWAAWLSHYREHPVASRVWQTGKPMLAAFSDLLTVREYHQLGIYRNVYRHHPIEDQLMLAWLTPQGGVLGFGVTRARRSFQKADRQRLAAFRPHLELAYRNAERYSEQVRVSRFPIEQTHQAALSAGLTLRQAQVLVAVLESSKIGSAAASLGISELTAKKHLENIYRFLGVGSKTEALTAVLKQLEQTSPGGFRLFWPTDAFIRV